MTSKLLVGPTYQQPTTPPPDFFAGEWEYFRAPVNARRLAGLVGRVHIHLYGNYERVLGINGIHEILTNLSANPEPPIITIGL